MSLTVEWNFDQDAVASLATCSACRHTVSEVYMLQLHLLEATKIATYD